MTSDRLAPFAAIFALSGFAVAEPVFDLLRRNPEFILARNMSPMDLWLLTLAVSIALPALLAAPAALLGLIDRRAGNGWMGLTVFTLGCVFFAQLLQPVAGHLLVLFLAASAMAGFLAAWALLRPQWRLLTLSLAILALVFPLRFLFFSPFLPQESTTTPGPTVSFDRPDPPNIVVVVFDELPLATLLDGNQTIDAANFPGFARLARTATWYDRATTVATSTLGALPPILNGRFPPDSSDPGAPNLFTLLRDAYDLNVYETYTTLCPEYLCPRGDGNALARQRSILSDLAAVFLHRLAPGAWKPLLPDVTTGWEGFFAIDTPPARMWARHVGASSQIDRPEYFRRFVQSITPRARPALHFLHIPFPHGPVAYLPDGSNYGREWLRGRTDGRWGAHRWSITSARQRYFLQTQLADRLLADLLERLDDSGLSGNSVLVVTADHGVSFRADDHARSLSRHNAAALLRIPLFIREPGQTGWRRSSAPVMTPDILPTVLGLVGASAGVPTLGGTDLTASTPLDARPRVVLSNDRIRPVAQDLDLTEAVTEARRGLRLDDSPDPPWRIGPFDQWRGQPLEAICESVTEGPRFRWAPFRPLPNTRPETGVHALISGSFPTGHGWPDPPAFAITSGNVIAASGFALERSGRWHVAVLVPPQLSGRADFSPEIFIVVDRQCVRG